MKKILPILLFAAFLCHGQTGFVRSAEGIRVPTAATMGQGFVYLGGSFETISDGEPLALKGTFSDGLGRNHEMESDVPSSGGAVQLAYGALDYFDIGLYLPVYYEGDIEKTDLGGIGLGDLQVSFKGALQTDFPIIPAFALEFFAPTGTRSIGFRPRHVWFIDSSDPSYAYTAGEWAIATNLYLTIHFSKILHWHNHAAYLRNFGNGNNALLYGTGFELFPKKMISVIVEASGETILRKNNMGSHFLNDPLRLTPGVRVHLPSSLDLTIGADIGLDFIRKTKVEHATYVTRDDGKKQYRYAIPGSPKIAINVALTKTFDFSWKDADRDGVYDRLDMCPGTNLGMQVNSRGCPVDEDQDGVLNIVDDCPGTPFGVAVDYFGCPLDADGDGVPDYLDKCAGTPEGTAVTADGCMMDSDGDGIDNNHDKCPMSRPGEAVDSVGCALDADRDGIPNTDDLCPGTPEGLSVDKSGCPLDDDKDGVPNNWDLCPESAPGEIVTDKGCPKDSDGDLVPDSKDECPDTPAGFPVDPNGCPTDSDKDGVPDALDKCSGTPRNAPIDSIGCLLDTDKDGVPDYLDKCSTLPGIKIDKQGCAIDSKQDLQAIAKRVAFTKDKKQLTEPGYAAINDVITLMREVEFKLEVIGSEKECNAIADYLDMKGFREDKIKFTIQNGSLQFKAFDTAE